MGDSLAGPLMWFANRGTGVVLMVLLTASVVLGIVSTTRPSSGWWPRFLTQGLHRNLSLLSTFMLVAHVVTAVVDEYVDIRWWQAFVPFGATYEPLWMAAGALSLDLIVAVVVTSLVRHRIPHRRWQLVHLMSYAAWALGIAHGLGIGTDSATAWSRWLTVACGAVVLFAIGVRVAARLSPAHSDAVSS